MNLLNERDRQIVLKVARMGESAEVVQKCNQLMSECMQRNETEFTDANAFISYAIREMGGRRGEQALEKLLDTPLVGSIEDLMR